MIDNWTWGLALIALTIAIHVTGVTFLVSVLHGFRVRLQSRPPASPHVIATIVVAAFTVMGLLLALLHGVEAAIWAVAYLWLGALDSPGAAILYSIDSMATRGASGVMPEPWQIMGALEAADGMLLFGISTAFIFTVMQFYYQHLVLLDRPGGSIQLR